MPENWYCLYTKARKEAQVANYCADYLGLQTYLPRLREQRTIRRQRRGMIGPLFPRYVFCRFDASILFRTIRYAPEMTGIVSVGNKPAIVTDALIENLRLWAGEERDVITLRPTPQRGDEVEVIGGPMQGLNGIFVANCNERERVRILLRFLECEAQTTLDRSEIRLIA